MLITLHKNATAIPATRCGHRQGDTLGIKQHKTATAAKAFLPAVRKAAPFTIRTLLTDNGKEFTDRLFGNRSRQPTGEHGFDRLCQALGIEHRLSQPKTAQTNGMVERFNGRHRFVWLYNHHLPQTALGHEALVQALKAWKMKASDLFVKNVRHFRDLTLCGTGDEIFNCRGID